MSDLLIYGVKGSPFVRKVQVLLAEKQLDYDLEAVMPMGMPDWFVELNPAKRIPVLRDRTVGTEGQAGTIPDSSAICAYLDRKYPDPRFYPEDAFELGRALWLEEYADSELAARVGLGMFRPVFFKIMAGKEPDLDTARTTLHETLPPFFDYLDAQAKGREFLVGGAFSIGDVAVASQFVNLQHVGGRVDADRWPALADYLARIHARPSFAAAIEDERALMKFPDIEL